MTQPTFDTVPTKKPRPRWLFPLIGGLLIFLLGVGIGSSGNAAEPEAKPTPVPTVTVTSEPEVKTETVTETVTVTEVPQACLDALSDAEAMNTIAYEMSQSVAGHMDSDGRLFQQFSGFDFENVDWYLVEQTEFQGEIEALTTRVQGNAFTTNAAACRAA